MSERPLLCAFLKVRNEIIREGNLHRVLRNIEQYCDAAVVCDDASTDGTREALSEWVYRQSVACSAPERWQMISVPPNEQDFRQELVWKQRMLDLVHAIKPEFVLWMDGDEVFDANGTKHLREFCESVRTSPAKAWRFHYTQFWRNTLFARTDSGFDDGWFLKLWRYSPDLTFETKPGTHHAQFPQQIMHAFNTGLVHNGPFEQLHYGNYGTNLRWKVIQYRGGLGGWERHLVFPNGTFRRVDQAIIPEGCERDDFPTSIRINGESISIRRLEPAPFTADEETKIRALYNLRGMEKMFTVIIPSYNRAATLPRALQSLLEQTYEQWIAIVLDDGSTDETPAVMRTWQDKDPRIFYCRYPENRGGVAMNEIGMTLACEMTEWWSRLGSDDWFGPRKLELDALALREHEAVYGPYHVSRDGQFAEVCNPPRPPAMSRKALLTQGFVASWANVAVRTSVLKRVRAAYGNFCDPALRNMEDFLVNARIAREGANWIWRGVVWNSSVIINPDDALAVEIIRRMEQRAMPFDTAWNVAMIGASANSIQTMQDENLTRSLITKENIARGKKE